MWTRFCRNCRDYVFLNKEIKKIHYFIFSKLYNGQMSSIILRLSLLHLSLRPYNPSFFRRRDTLKYLSMYFILDFCQLEIWHTSLILRNDLILICVNKVKAVSLKCGCGWEWIVGVGVERVGAREHWCFSLSEWTKKMFTTKTLL